MRSGFGQQQQQQQQQEPPQKQQRSCNYCFSADHAIVDCPYPWVQGSRFFNADVKQPSNFVRPTKPAGSRNNSRQRDRPNDKNNNNNGDSYSNNYQLWQQHLQQQQQQPQPVIDYDRLAEAVTERMKVSGEEGEASASATSHTTTSCGTGVEEELPASPVFRRPGLPGGAAGSQGHELQPVATQPMIEKKFEGGRQCGPHASIQPTAPGSERSFLRGVLSTTAPSGDRMSANQPTTILVDSGAACNIIAVNELERFGLRNTVWPLTTPITISGVCGSSSSALGWVPLSITLAGVTKDTPVRSQATTTLPLWFLVVDTYLTGAKALLGREGLVALCAVTDWVNNTLSLENTTIPMLSRSVHDTPATVGTVSVAAITTWTATTTVNNETHPATPTPSQCELLDGAAQPWQPAVLALLEETRADRCSFFAKTHLPSSTPVAPLTTKQEKKVHEEAARLAAQVRAEWSKKMEEHVQKIKQEECNRVDALLDNVLSFLKEADRDDSKARPSLFGDEVKNLTQAQSDKLARLISDLGFSFLDPTKVARSEDAKPLPYTAVLQFKENKQPKPTNDGMYRRFSPEQMEEITRQLYEMARAGVVEPAKVTSRWAHAVVLAKKADGSWRFCIDYKPINAQTVVEQYQVAAHGGFYSRYDLKAAYWHVPLDESSREYTAFYVPGHGLWQFRVLAFGLASAVALFQRTMEDIFRPLLYKGVVVYLDDLIIYASSLDKLLKLTEEVHALFIECDLRLAPKKCELFTSSTKVLGHVVSRGVVSQNRDHLRAILDYEKPNDVTSLRRFLGMASWHRTFVPGYAHLAAPLIHLEVAAHKRANRSSNRAHDRTPIVWTDEAHDAFGALLQALSSAPCVVVPDMTTVSQPRRWMLMSDGHGASLDGSSRGGVGSLLYWKNDAGEWGLVQAISRSLTDGERKYTATQLELCALVEGVRCGTKYLDHAREALFVVDHDCLKFLTTMRNKSAGILARWSYWILSYDFVLTYRKGREHVAPDAISRAVARGALPVWHGRTWDELHKDDTFWEEVTNADSIQLASVQTSAEQEDIFTQLNLLVNEGRTFDLIEIDPPYPYKGNTCTPPYRTMSIDDLTRLPIGRLTHSGSVVLIWYPGGHWHTAPDLVRAWGLKPATVGWVWDKVKSTIGNYTTPRCEFVGIAHRGGTRLIRDGQQPVDQLLVELKRQHSRKPEGFYSSVGKVFPSAQTKLSVFSRTQRPGWTCVGDQTRMFLASLSTELAPVETRSRAAGAPSKQNEPKKDADKAPVGSRASKKTSTHVPPADSDRWLSGDAHIPSSASYVEEDRRTIEEQRATAATLSLWESPACANAMIDLAANKKKPLPAHVVASVRSQETAQKNRATTRLSAQHLTAEAGAELSLAPITLDECQRWAAEHRNLLQRVHVPLMVNGDWSDVTTFLSQSHKNGGENLAALALLVDAGTDFRCAFVPDTPSTRTFRTALVRRLHQSIGHRGVKKTVSHLALAGWRVENAKVLAREVIAVCDACGSAKGYPAARWLPSGLMDHSLRPAGFNHVVHVDLVGPLSTLDGKKQWILSATDELIRLTELAVLDDASAATTARALHSLWFCRYGPPEYLSHDKGGNFISDVLSELKDLWTIGTLRTTSWHPQANAIEERQHRSLKELLRAVINQTHLSAADWPSVLPVVSYLLRHTVHSSLGDHTPFELLTGETGVAPDMLVEVPEFARLESEDVLRVKPRTSSSGPSLDKRAFRASTVATIRNLLVSTLRAAEAGLRGVAKASQLPPSEKPLTPARVLQRPTYRPGDFVRVWNGKSLKADPLVLNHRLSPRCWSEPWRVLSVTPDGSVLNLTLCSDPLVVERVSWMLVKPTALEPEVAARTEELFIETMKQKDEIRDELQLARAPANWVQEPVAEEDKCEVERVLESRVVAGERQALVKFTGIREPEWLPRSELCESAPEAWADFLRGRNMSAKKAARSKK